MRAEELICTFEDMSARNGGAVCGNKHYREREICYSFSLDMAERRGNKRTYIPISSSSGDEEEEEESESEEYDNDDEIEETSASTSSGDDDDDESGSEWSDAKRDESDDDDDDDEEEEEEEDEESSNLDNDESLCNNVICLLREKGDLQELKLKDCKSYLRQHGLRITGTKVECIQRIMEHWRIKDGNAESLYPRSSFAINCTGDVCKGDVVLFTQKVYKKFDKMTRSGSFLRKRTIAGRVVKESYGAAKQQHTFTIEVLWSKGIKKLPPLFPLLVKGRNLYKLKTFRQPWKNERERQKVLAEKHQRGAAARLVRSMKKTQKACSKNRGVKRQKQFHQSRPSQTGKKTEPQKGKHSVGRGKAPEKHTKSNNHRRKAPPAGRANLKKNPNSRAPKTSMKYQNPTHPNKDGDQTRQSFVCSPQNFHQSQMQLRHHLQWSAPLHIPSYETGSTSSTMRFPNFRPYLDPSGMPVTQHQGLYRGSYPHHAYPHPSHAFESRNLNRSSDLRTFVDCQNHFPWGRWHTDRGGAL